MATIDQQSRVLTGEDARAVLRDQMVALRQFMQRLQFDASCAVEKSGNPFRRGVHQPSLVRPG